MTCTRCKNGKIVAHAFSEQLCKGACGILVQTHYSPGNKYCIPCSDRLHICNKCGTDMANDIT